MRWRRLRKWAKWGCTVAAVLTLALAVFSGFYQFRWIYRPRPVGQLCVTSGEGLLWVVWEGDILSVWDGFFLSRGLSWRWGLRDEKGVPGWRAGVLYERHSQYLLAGTSFLYPELLTSLSAALLWYADRRRSGPNACNKCGYDRSGLVGGADTECPECGTVPVPAAK